MCSWSTHFLRQHTTGILVALDRTSWMKNSCFPFPVIVTVLGSVTHHGRPPTEPRQCRCQVMRIRSIEVGEGAHVDDAAFAFGASSTEEELANVDRAQIILHPEMSAFGLEINFAQGKTEAMVGLRRFRSRSTVCDRWPAPRIRVDLVRHMETLRCAASSGRRDAYARARSTTSVCLPTASTFSGDARIPMDTRTFVVESILIFQLLFGVSTLRCTSKKRLVESCTIAECVFLRKIVHCECYHQDNNTPDKAVLPCLGCFVITHLACCWLCWTHRASNPLPLLSCGRPTHDGCGATWGVLAAPLLTSLTLLAILLRGRL